ncbi:MAG: hypothetical protein ACI9W2_004286, partial [Gammaproteobacteria bacterium]
MPMLIPKALELTSFLRGDTTLSVRVGAWLASEKGAEYGVRPLAWWALKNCTPGQPGVGLQHELVGDVRAAAVRGGIQRAEMAQIFGLAQQRGRKTLLMKGGPWPMPCIQPRICRDGQIRTFRYPRVIARGFTSCCVTLGSRRS